MRSIIDQTLEFEGGAYNKQVYLVNTDYVKGKSKYFQLQSGIEFSVNTFTYKEDTKAIFHGDKESDRFICFRFTYDGDITQASIDAHNINDSNNADIIVYDTSVTTEFVFKKGETQKWVGVRINRAVMENDEHLFKEFFGDIFTKEKGNEWFLYDSTPLEIHILLKDIYAIDETKTPIIQNTLLVARSSEMISIFFDRLMNRTHKPNKGLHSQDFEQLLLVKDHLLSSLDDVPSLDELSEMYGFSVSKLRRDFQQVFGTSIIKFHLNYRLEKAKIMLASKSVNIQTVSRACGFKSSSKFSFYFKKKYGIKPKELAKKYFQ